MQYTKESIIDFIRSNADHPMKMKALAQALNIKSKDYARFRNVVKSLIASGDLIKLKRGQIGLADEMNIVVGELMVTKSGTGFLADPTGEQDIMIPSSALANALDGDKVMVRLTGSWSDRRLGTVIRVQERSGKVIVGSFQQGPHYAFVKPDNRRIHRHIYIPSDRGGGAKDGQKVVCEITAFEDASQSPVGRIVEVIGYPQQPGVDMISVMRNYGFTMEFSDAVLAEAEKAASGLQDAISNRVDLTSELIFTIDPEDAKDFDDAISVVRKRDGYQLSVHIADVSYFVTSGTELDSVAFDRGTSVYLPGMVIPMLPEVLSNNVCSLMPNRKRLAFSVTMEIDKNGKMLKWRLQDTVIKSQARLSYEDAQDFFDNGLPDSGGKSKVRRVAESLTIARELANKLSQQRFKNGSLDFDLPESKMILNDKGEVTELGSKVRLEAHRLIEEFMLAANRAVAFEVFRLGLPFIYRVHDKPDLEKLEAFSHLMKQLGYKFPVSKNIRPKDMAKFLKEIHDVPEADFINELMLRSMQKAVYQRENIGHFGLAFSHYTHFTSPIRRYPDLLVHRLLRSIEKGKYPSQFARRIVGVIDNVGKHCSERERIAESAEREAIKIKQVAFMARYVGDEFDGVVSGVTNFGFFVRLANFGAEGLVRVSTLEDDYYNFDERTYTLTGSRHGKKYRLGDQVRVVITNVNTENNEIELGTLQKKRTVTRARRPVSTGKSKHPARQKNKVAHSGKRRGTGKATSKNKAKNKNKGKSKNKGKRR